MSAAGFDYVVVGGGSAGCVLANRLSADPAVSVLLVEAGPRDSSLMMRMPAGVYQVYLDRRFNWNYESAPQRGMHDRRIPVPRGRVLGGSSSINSMVYLRGHPRDYDRWAGNQLPGWDYAHCLPYFRRSETSDKGPNAYRGGDGPLSVETGTLDSPIFDAFLGAAEDAGHAISADLNGAQPEGFGRFDTTKKNGRRCSAAVAYLHPVAHRANLTVLTGCLVLNVILQGNRAVGISYVRDGVTQTARAAVEVVLSAGSINTPKLLMLSGIGPADELRRHGLAVRHELAGVGANLQDHMDVQMQFRTRDPISLAWLRHPWGKLYAGARWMLDRSGPAASNIFEVGGVFASSADADHANMQIHVAPVMLEVRNERVMLAEGLMLHVSQLRQESRGSIKLGSADPREAPAIQFDFLATARDRREFRDAIRLMRDLVGRGSMSSIVAEEVQPGADLTSDDALDGFVRRMAETEYHPCGTCRMGVDDHSVVDPELRVHGVDGLRVVDASVMPTVVSSNLNGPTIMIAEKAADLILGRPALPPARPS